VADWSTVTGPAWARPPAGSGGLDHSRVPNRAGAYSRGLTERLSVPIFIPCGRAAVLASEARTAPGVLESAAMRLNPSAAEPAAPLTWSGRRQ
jgi:hypothetical protein